MLACSCIDLHNLLGRRLPHVQFSLFGIGDLTILVLDPFVTVGLGKAAPRSYRIRAFSRVVGLMWRMTSKMAPPRTEGISEGGRPNMQRLRRCHNDLHDVSGGKKNTVRLNTAPFRSFNAVKPRKMAPNGNSRNMPSTITKQVINT